MLSTAANPAMGQEEIQHRLAPDVEPHQVVPPAEFPVPPVDSSAGHAVGHKSLMVDLNQPAMGYRD
jgi:hypothetical protein